LVASERFEIAHLSATVNVTAFSARQKVTGFVVDEISTNMHAGEPRLVVGERICWRVPVILSMPPIGDRAKSARLTLTSRPVN
jgi:hypothetical protein